jgi:GNAT superfamily N-acetyltransferase
MVRPGDLGSKGPLESFRVENQGQLGEKEEGEQEEQVEFPAKAGLSDFVHQKTREVLEYWMDGRRHILVNALCVLPQHQKAGVGKLLLGKMHKFADRERILLSCRPCHLGIGYIRRRAGKRWRNWRLI